MARSFLKREWLKGRAAFLYEMLSRDISNINLTKLPKNQSEQRLTDQLQTAPNHIKFVHDLLADPYFCSYLNIENPLQSINSAKDLRWDEDGWHPPKELFHRMYLNFSEKIGESHPLSKDVLIRSLNQSVPMLFSPGKRKEKSSHRTPILKFPSLENARNRFTEATELNIVWEN